MTTYYREQCHGCKDLTTSARDHPCNQCKRLYPDLYKEEDPQT